MTSYQLLAPSDEGAKNISHSKHKTSGGAGGLEINYYLFSTAYAFSVAVLRFLPYQTTIAP